jgi:hypothetical protein
MTRSTPLLKEKGYGLPSDFGGLRYSGILKDYRNTGVRSGDFEN